MVKLVKFVFILLVILSCNRKEQLTIYPEDIIKIKIISFMENYEGKAINEIYDKRKINKIISCINNAKNEPIKFIPIYKLIFYTKNGFFEAVFNGRAMSINRGTKYFLGCDIEGLIK